MDTSSAVRPSVNRMVALGVGAFLVLVFFGLRMTAPGLRITFHPPLNASSPGEAIKCDEVYE